jgi:hypothetical protein
MSAFGDGSFKQRLLDHIISECEDEGIDLLYGVEAAMEVVTHLATEAYRRDAGLKAIYERAKRDAREELLSKLR